MYVDCALEQYGSTAGCRGSRQLHACTMRRPAVLTAPNSSMMGLSLGSKASASASNALLVAALKSLEVLVMSTSTLRRRSRSDWAANRRSEQTTTAAATRE